VTPQIFLTPSPKKLLKKLMSWLKRNTTLFDCINAKQGVQKTFEEILLTYVAMEHKWYHKDDTGEWVNGSATDIDTICKLRAASSPTSPKINLKQKLYAFSPSASNLNRDQGNASGEPTGLLQIDFDAGGLLGFDLKEVKQAIFKLPFVAFCSLSCSGSGIYTLIEIAEPEKLREYADHLFHVFQSYGVSPDTTKGGNMSDLRFMSYDCNMLIRDNPTPLKVTRFQSKVSHTTPVAPPNKQSLTDDAGWIDNQLEKLRTVSPGNRFNSIRSIAFALGGTQKYDALAALKQEILSNELFRDEIDKFLSTAESCFQQGFQKPFNITHYADK
jgi:hypothetical protein